MIEPSDAPFEWGRWVETYPLPQLEEFHFAVIDAPLEDVRDLLCGQFLAAQRHDTMERDGYLRQYVMLTGQDAAIDKEFGDTPSPRSAPEASEPYLYPGMSMSPVWRGYTVFGSTRIARVRSAPNLTYIEERDRLVMFTDLGELSRCFATPAMVFQSVIASPDLENGGSPQDAKWVGWDEDFLQSIHVHNPDKRYRFMAAHRSDANWPPKDKPRWRYNIEQHGDLAVFEDVEDYKPRLIKKRFSREVMRRQLERLGIDPIATLGRRELDDPVLFAEGLKGDPVANYPETLMKLKSVRVEANARFGEFDISNI